MHSAPAPQRDPIGWSAVIALAFLALVWHRLGIPSQIYFDEVHYVKAARLLLEERRVNVEHPMVAKEIIAAAIALLGDRPLCWRLPSALFGAFGLFAFGRLLWWSSRRRFATLAGMFLLATGFMWFIQSRIAMLDIFMASLGMAALWQFAAALDSPAGQARWRLAATGILLGLAIGAKWSIVPAAMLPGLAFLAIRLKTSGWRFLTATQGGPVAGISLVEAAFWLGILPLAVYWATFTPTFFFKHDPVNPFDFIGHHRYMIELQDSVVKPHPYRSVWYQWIVNWRPVWYLYEPVDGAQRGVLLLGNPFSMLAGLPALFWCLWAGMRRRRHDALAFALLYLASIGMWIVTEKPVQFYYHYLLPGAFLMGCLALALEEMWRAGGKWRWAAVAALVVTAGIFAWFYPILSSAALHGGSNSFVKWMWLDSWR
ncbi:MAG: phospholipid carrier-dependent glycosyltransferase [Novosphingobium sp.]|nr:phospholipid carrier-dependent glycosyltransferase [Novosphingobium sp.]